MSPSEADVRARDEMRNAALEYADAVRGDDRRAEHVKFRAMTIASMRFAILAVMKQREHIAPLVGHEGVEFHDATVEYLTSIVDGVEAMHKANDG